MIKNFLKSYFINKFKISKVGEVKDETKEEEININPRYKIYTDTVKILANPENSQLDNKYSPRSACNVTALQIAMALDINITDDELFILCNSKEIADKVKRKYPEHWSWIKLRYDKGSANEVWVVLEEVGKHVVGNDYCKIIHNLSIQKIIDEINMGYAVVINGKFTHAGHFVTVVGYDLNKGVYIVNDPFGDWNSGYKEKKFLNLKYPFSKLKIRNPKIKKEVDNAFLSNMAILVHSDKRIPAI